MSKDQEKGKIYRFVNEWLSIEGYQIPDWQDLLDGVHELESQSFGEWISCEDRLPKEQTVVLIYRGDDGEETGFEIMESMYSNGEFGLSRHDSKMYWNDVLHWMPLPKPPISNDK